jgi:hypothetical protein
MSCWTIVCHRSSERMKEQYIKIHKKFSVAQLIKKFLVIYNFEGSQELANGLCPQPDESSPNSYTQYKVHFNIILKYMPKSPKRPLPYRISIRMLYTFSYHPCYMSRSFQPPWLCYRTRKGSVRVESFTSDLVFTCFKCVLRDSLYFKCSAVIYCSYEAHYWKHKTYQHYIKKPSVALVR